MDGRASDLEEFITKVRKGELGGEALANMVKAGTLSKSERRLITRKASKPELTPRQQLRQEIKAKKAIPRGKLSAEERRERFRKLDEVEEQRLKDKANFTVCLGCRKRGHLLKDCPKANPAAQAVAAAADGVCFNCGSSDHALRDCKKPRDRNGKLPFAFCFICKQKGHIARDCDNNANGLYPQGGCCHVCLQKTHLAKDCPERTEEMKEEWARRRELQRQAEEDQKLGPRVKGISVGDKTTGDDDIGDDFEGAREEDNDDDESRDKKKKKRKDRDGEKGQRKRSEKKKRT